MVYEELFGLDTSAVSEANFASVFGNLLEGVFLGVDNECRVYADGAALVVEVMTGTFITGGVFGRVTAQETLVIGVAPAAPDKRIDRIVLRRDQATNALTLVVLPGTPGNPPAGPTALTRNGTYEISLAQVYVGSGVVVINPEDVTDERGEAAVCGYVSGNAFEQISRNFVQGNRQWGAWSAYGHATALALEQLYAQSMVVDAASAVQVDADGVALVQDTSGAANNDAYVLGAYNAAGPVLAPCHARRYWSVWECKFKLDQIVTERVFVGLGSSPDPTVVLASDDPVGDYAGLQFSTARPDTNFQFVVKDNAVQVVHDSGIAVDTAAHIVRVVFRPDETWGGIFLLDTNRNVEASIWTNLRLPTLATNLYPWSGVRALAAAVKSIGQYYAHGVNRKV